MTIEQKILISLFDYLKDKETKYVRYEDFLVHAFKLFPESLSLKFYPEYPDSELIKKRLYDTIKPKGIIKIKQHQLRFTEYGQSISENLFNQYMGFNKKATGLKNNDLSTNEKSELRRLLNHKGFQLFLINDKTEILDIDIYDFFEISVRTTTSDVKSRISITNALLKNALHINNSQIERLSEYKDLLLKKYKEIQNANNT